MRCLGRCDVDSLVDDLDSAPWNVMDSVEDVDSQCNYWKKLFEEIAESHAPTKKARVKRKSLPWINREIRAMMRARSYFQKSQEKQQNRGLGEIQEG